ncbi:hypothetical protein SprV_0100498300 [Sparganum proliferum]
MQFIFPVRQLNFVLPRNHCRMCMLKLSRICGHRGLLACARLQRRFVSSFSDNSRPPSYPNGLRDHPIDQMFGAYEEVLSVRIHFLRQGIGAKNILLFPGPFGSASTDYMDFLRRLNRNEFTAIAFDPPGCGFSIPPARDWNDPEILLQDARVGVNLMRQLGHLPFFCVGWSEGAQSAILAASELNFDDSIQGLVVWDLDEDITTEGGPGNCGHSSGRSSSSLGSKCALDSWSDGRRLRLQALYGKEYMRDSWPAYVETKEIRRIRPAILRCLPQRLLRMPLLHITSRLSEARQHQDANSHSTESALLTCPGYRSTVWPDAEQEASWRPPHQLHADFFQSCVETFILESIQ